MPLDRAAASDHPWPPIANRRNVGAVGMYLFLAALGMLFFSSLLGYVAIRLTGPTHPALGTIHLPGLLWLSTVLVLGVSVAIRQATVAVRGQRLPAFRRWLTITLLCAAGFILVQSPAMWELLRTHQQRVATGGVRLYGLIFVLVLLHALHVVGGIISLTVVGLNAARNLYDHEHFQPVRYAAMYWHFLDVVWLIMFATLLVTR